MLKNEETQLLDKLLKEWSLGDKNAENKLITLLYPHIHKIARMQFKSKHANSLQTTEIVSEAFIKLNQQKSFEFKNKSHFLAITAKIIRRVVVDHYRSINSQKRGGHEQIMTLERFENILEEPMNFDADWLVLNDLLNNLHLFDSEAATVLEYKVFGGLSYPEMAIALSVSESTVLRNWNFAKSWIIRQLQK